MKVLIVGSGGREHALGWKLSQSSMLEGLYFAPGNPGCTQVGANIDIQPGEFEKLGEFVLENGIGIVVVGPEQPLVEGIHDHFNADERFANVTIIGPSKEGAILEASKDFAKAFMQRNNIPTAAYQTFTANTLDEGLAFLETLRPPYVLKSDGLAGGKGVVIPDTLEEAQQELRSMLVEEKFGQASAKVVIEEYLDGEELSIFAITDGHSYKILPMAKDHKRIGEGDTGPNTGGMGAVSPVPSVDKHFMKKIEELVVNPTIKGLHKENIPYQGFLFFGLMKVKEDPYVVEYNVRMGDPEAQVVFPRLSSDLLDLFEGIASDTLSERHVEIDPRSAATVVLVSEGYPGKYEKGKVITGLDAVSDSLVFHAGTKNKEGKLVTNGGRVLTVTSLGKDLEEAVRKSNENANKIAFEGKTFRRDIGASLLKNKEKTM